MVNAAPHVGSKLAGTRTRFQRLADARFFSGWIQQLDARGAVIDFDGGEEVRVGEEFFFEISGKKHTYSFRGRLVLASGKHLAFQILGDLRLGPVREEVRVAASGAQASVTSANRGYLARVADISPSGVGLLMSVALEREATVELAIDTAQGEVTCKGVVRYCRTANPAGTAFRVGLALLLDDRCAQAKWLRQFDELA